MYIKVLINKTCLMVAAGMMLNANQANAADQVDINAPKSVTGEAQVSVAIDNTLGDHKAYQLLLQQLQDAVRADNRQQVASLISFPIEAFIDGKAATITDTSAFLAFYDKIMTPDILSAILDTAYADVTVSWQGVMLGDGQVWINGICTDNACSDVEVRVSTLQGGLN